MPPFISTLSLKNFLGFSSPLALYFFHYSSLFDSLIYNDGDYSHRYGGVPFYFVGRFNQQFDTSKSGTWTSAKMFPKQFDISTVNGGAYFTFPATSGLRGNYRDDPTVGLGMCFI